MKEKSVKSFGSPSQLGDIQNRVVREIDAAIEASDLGRAYDLASLALSKGMRHATFHRARAFRLLQTQHHAAALLEAQHAVLLAPSDLNALECMGLCLLQLDRSQEAVRAFEGAIVAEPKNAQLYYHLGRALALTGDHDAAYAAHDHAVKIDPYFAEALASLASIAARQGAADRARAFAERALALDARQPTANVALAVLEIAQKQFSQAENRLRSLLARDDLGSQPRTAILGLLGDALDGQKRYAEAFAAYAEENGELRRLHAQRFSGNHGLDAANHLIDYFQSADASRWKASAILAHDSDGPREHVFLLGFMRSGTTLLEQVLASSDQVIALEEKGLLSGLGETFFTSVPALDSLAALQEAELDELRRLYWERVGKQGAGVKDKIFVDKQPLNTTKLPLIAKLFPRAKILFALRDPRDVVFSCFRRHFKTNVTMYEFLDLADAARFYAAIMQLAEIYRAKLPLNLLEHRYEEMVVDFDASMRSVCAFIGLEWEETMRNFEQAAPNVDIRSPSAMQVRRPLYGEGIGQWQRYAQQLEPILPILQPWVERFGYSAA